MRRGSPESGRVGQIGGGEHVQAGQDLAGRPRPRLDHRAETGRDPQRTLDDRVGDVAGPQARERDVDALQRGRRAGAAEGGLGADPG
jgi:hypothetical protein